jgi:hypothetical protein
MSVRTYIRVFISVCRASKAVTCARRSVLQWVAGNKKGEFEVEAQFLSKLHEKNGYFFS